MSEFLVLAAVNKLWFLPPLALVISLVYNTSRYESPLQIIRRSSRLFITILLFMTLVLGFLYAVSP